MAEISATKNLINDYLFYGYLPPNEIPSFLFTLKADIEYDYSVEYASRLLDEIFEEALRSYMSGGICVIPVSGGWDSRILLGLALKHFESDRIRTYTFGGPGQLDFEIGRKIAEHAGVNHVPINLENIELTWEKLKESVNHSPWTYALDSFFNNHCYRSVSDERDFILSGFMGDPLTGGHAYTGDNEAAAEIFVKNQAITKSRITSAGYNPVDSLPEISGSSLLSHHQLLDLGVRQAHCITRIISSKKAWDNFGLTLGPVNGSNAELITPFAAKKWIQYWTEAPGSAIKNRKLYLDLLHYKFPKLAGLPSKNYYGARKSAGLDFSFRKKIYHSKILLNFNFPSLFKEPPHMMNYLNYARAFRNRDDYKKILSQARDILREQRLTPWLDFERYIREHNTGTADHSKIFLLLIGLALNISINDLKRIDENE